MTDGDNATRTDQKLTRRHLLMGGAAAGLGTVAGIGVGAAARPLIVPETINSDADHGGQTIPFHGIHQAGIDTPPQAHATFLALDMRPQTDRNAIKRMLRILTDDACRLTDGTGALADMEPELAAKPARLTVTFGFGPELVKRVNANAPTWLRPLPSFSVDRLEDQWSNGDLLLHVASDDPITIAHATRMLLKDARTFATLRWTQTGFRRARGSEPAGTTMRNLFGQVDGTVNPSPGTDDFENLVWSGGEPGWLQGGTSLIVRRIAMDLDTWDRLDRSGRETAIGRTLDTGAPLTGVTEHDEVDFAATDGLGFPVIPVFAHIRRARSDDTRQRIFRRGYNYDDAPKGDTISNSGLIFVSYQADIDSQFVPLQQRLNELDMLNMWTTPIGSAVFAIPPGTRPDGFIGETLFAA